MTAKIKAYREQPFARPYTINDLERCKNGCRTKDGKYHTFTDKQHYSYWTGENCYHNRAYGYFFLCQSDDDIITNLNQSLSDTYEFNPIEFERKHEKFELNEIPKHYHSLLEIPESDDRTTLAEFYDKL